MEYTQLEKGMIVTYIPKHHKQIVPFGNAKDYEGREVGKVTSWNESYVFVDYSNSGRGNATMIEDLVKGNKSFYCSNEWDSVLDGAFGRCGSQCQDCGNGSTCH